MRRAAAADLDALLEVNRASALAAYRHIFGDDPFPDARVRERFERLLASPAHTVLVAEQDGVAVGLVAAAADLLEALYVRPEAWSRGVASRLLEAAEPLLAPEATLWVLEENERGRRFWESRGWQADGGRKLEHGRVELRYRRRRRQV